MKTILSEKEFIETVERKTLPSSARVFVETEDGDVVDITDVLLILLGNKTISTRVEEENQQPIQKPAPKPAPIVKKKQQLHASHKGTKKVFHHRKSSGTWRVWTRDEANVLKNWYADPNNHYATGEVIGKKMAEFAQSLNRTQMACQVQVIKMGLNKKPVFGKVKRPGKSKPKQHFPKLASVNKNDNLLANLFQQFASSKGNTLKYNHFMSMFGIDTLEAWSNFVQEVVQKSDKICSAINVKNEITVVKEGGATWLRYGNK